MTRRFAVPLLLVPLCSWSQGATANQEWSAFMDWMRERTPGEFIGVTAIFAGYQKKLIADGMDPAMAQAVAIRLRERSGTSSEWMAITFNRLYTSLPTAGRAADQPNAFLADVVSGLKPGKALDLGSGEGRNSVFFGAERLERNSARSLGRRDRSQQRTCHKPRRQNRCTRPGR